MRALDLKDHEETKKRLLNLAEELPGAWLGLKIAALLLIAEGQRPGWTAEVLGLSRMSLTRWIHGVNRKGVQTLREPGRRGGRRSQLERVRKFLEKDLERLPEAVGIRRARWDAPTLAQHVQKRYGVSIKVRQAQNWLHAMGYRLKRAGYVYVQARAEDAQRFRRHIKKAPAAWPA